MYFFKRRRDGKDDDADLRSEDQTGRIKNEETTDAYIQKVGIKGISMKSLNVEVEEEDKAIIITGEKKKMDDKKIPRFMEQSPEKVLIRLSIPENGNISQIKAYMDRGILKVTVPKKYEVDY